jgi:hypothetical protein
MFELRPGTHNGRLSGGLFAVVACLVLLALPTSKSATWGYCDDVVWNGWGARCCGENNLWQMGYCDSSQVFHLNCTLPYHSVGSEWRKAIEKQARMGAYAKI